MTKAKKHSPLLTTFWTYLVVVLYLTSTNHFFIPFLGFKFILSKLILLFLSPLLIIGLAKRGFKPEKVDWLFYIFILIFPLKTGYYNTFDYLSDLSNYLLPYIFCRYIVFKSIYIDIRLLLKLLLIFVFIHSVFGLVQFFTQNRDLVFFEKIQEFKITQVENYFFNPFKNLKLLPHGLYSYSSVFSISLVFPFFIALGSKSIFKNKYFYFVLILTIGFTIFCCFSRFEILSSLSAILVSLFAIKSNRVQINRLYSLLILAIISVIGMAIYFYNYLGHWGTLTARIVNTEMIQNLFSQIEIFIVGGDYFNLVEDYKMNVPHNIYVYCLFAFGLIPGTLILTFFLKKGLSSYKFMLKLSRYSNFVLWRPIFMNTLYYLYIFLFRGFDYYILDGYENIFLIFFCLLIFEISKKQAIVNELYKYNYEYKK